MCKSTCPRHLNAQPSSDAHSTPWHFRQTPQAALVLAVTGTRPQQLRPCRRHRRRSASDDRSIWGNLFAMFYTRHCFEGPNTTRCYLHIASSTHASPSCLFSCCRGALQRLGPAGGGWAVRPAVDACRGGIARLLGREDWLSAGEASMWVAWQHPLVQVTRGLSVQGVVQENHTGGRYRAEAHWRATAETIR